MPRIFMTKPQNVILFIAVAVIVSIIVISLDMKLVTKAFLDYFPKPIHTELVSKTSSLDRLPIYEAESFTTRNDTAFVFLALGAQANQMNCPAAIESLVRYGGWGGDVYMITDRMECFDRTSIVRNAGMNASNFHMVHIDEDFSGGGFDFSHKNVGARKHRVRSFAMKTRIFEYIPDERIKIAAYIDCDIIFGIPGCPLEYINIDQDWEKSKVKVSHIFRDNRGAIVGVHVGTLVAHREHSKEAMEIWRNEIQTNKYISDNDAYIAAFMRYEEQVRSATANTTNTNTAPATSTVRGSGSNPSSETSAAVTAAAVAPHRALSTDMLSNPLAMGELVVGDTRNSSNWYEKFLEPLTPSLHCMNHISKARCSHFGRETVQEFVDQFHLRTYGNRYMYCTHDLLLPFLYGWFPFKYLPSCPKLEAIL